MRIIVVLIKQMCAFTVCPDLQPRPRLMTVYQYLPLLNTHRKRLEVKRARDSMFTRQQPRHVAAL